MPARLVVKLSINNLPANAQRAHMIDPDAVAVSITTFGHAE